MKLGFIGCGNMASAMIGGIIKNQVVAPADILASAKTEVSREKKKEELGIAMTADNREVAAFAVSQPADNIGVFIRLERALCHKLVQTFL